MMFTTVVFSLRKRKNPFYVLFRPFLYSFFLSLHSAAALVPAEFNRSESCARLESPPNGDLNCLSWTWGQMCRPSCSSGHVFFRPLPSAVYLCGRDRRWKPGTSVPDCARKYTTHVSFSVGSTYVVRFHYRRRRVVITVS